MDGLLLALLVEPAVDLREVVELELELVVLRVWIWNPGPKLTSAGRSSGRPGMSNRPVRRGSSGPRGAAEPPEDAATSGGSPGRPPPHGPAAAPARLPAPAAPPVPPPGRAPAGRGASRRADRPASRAA